MKNLDAALLRLEDSNKNINSSLLISTKFRKDRKKWFLFFILIIFPVMAHAQLELYSKFDSNGSVEPIINYYGSKKINNQFSLTFFGLTREKWGQALIGLSYSPIDKIIFSVSAGIEQDHNSPRYSSSIRLKNGSNSFLALIEVGGGNNNFLYKVNLFHEFSEKISLGIMDWRYHGLGPNFRYTITKLKLTLWIMPAYDHEQETSRCMLGISVPM